jgi:hypothetical protein
MLLQLKLGCMEFPIQQENEATKIKYCAVTTYKYSTGMSRSTRINEQNSCTFAPLHRIESR